jgi:hypothetical protein
MSFNTKNHRYTFVHNLKAMTIHFKDENDNLQTVSIANPLPITGGGGGGGSSADKEFVVTTYRASSNFSGASIGDTITATQVYDTTTSPPSLSNTIWYNQSQVAVLGSVPSAANLEVVGVNALTDAQLRAAAIPVNQSGVFSNGNISALNANLTTGAATANSAIALNLNGATGFSVDVRGVFVATLLVQGLVDSNWITLSVLPIGAGLNIAQVANITGAGAWWGNGHALQQVRVTCSSFTSGSATVAIRAMQATGMVFNMPVGQTTQPVTGTVTINPVPAGTNGIGDVGLIHRANATGAATSLNIVSTANTNSTIVKNAAGRLVGYHLTNTSAAVRYVKFHNQTTAPTAGTGVVVTIGIPAGGTVFLSIVGGIAFTTGIGMTIVTGSAAADATAVAAGDVVGTLMFA